MPTLQNKIDFILTIDVDNANPNGDPLSGNMPRTDANGYGLISDVAIKRKLRNRLQDLNQAIWKIMSILDGRTKLRTSHHLSKSLYRSTRTCIDHYGEIRWTDRRIEYANHTQH